MQSFMLSSKSAQFLEYMELRTRKYLSYGGVNTWSRRCRGEIAYPSTSAILVKYHTSHVLDHHALLGTNGDNGLIVLAGLH